MAEEDPTKALHYSAGKSGVDQIPPAALLAIGDVFSYGEKKYFRGNWLKGNDWHEFLGSALRHLLKWADREDVDPESGLPHLSHAAWNILALMHYQETGLGNDDRIGENHE